MKVNPIDKKSLHDCYIKSSFKLTTGETWNEEDEMAKGEE